MIFIKPYNEKYFLPIHARAENSAKENKRRKNV